MVILVEVVVLKVMVKEELEEMKNLEEERSGGCRKRKSRKSTIRSRDSAVAAAWSTVQSTVARKQQQQ